MKIINSRNYFIITLLVLLFFYNGDSKNPFLVFSVDKVDQPEPFVLINPIVLVKPKRQINPDLFKDDIFSQESETPIYQSHELNGYENGTRLMGFQALWRENFFGKGQVVAVTDTGLDTGVRATLHRDLRRIKSVKVFSEDPDNIFWGDSHGHGTLVSGLVVGAGLFSRGRIKGGAYRAELISQSIFDPSSKEMSYPENLNLLFDHAYERGARVHNLSFGSRKSLGSYSKQAQEIDEYMWQKQDMLVVVAAGNTGKDSNKDGRVDLRTISPPATAKNALTVGASENWTALGGLQVTSSELNNGMIKWPINPLRDDFISNNPKGLAAFSARGPTKDGRRKPDIVAPGTNILSTKSQDPKAGSFWGDYNQYYSYSGGTSMAAGLVSAAAVLTREFFIKVHKQKAPTAALIKAALLHTARDIFPGQFGLVGKSRGQEILRRRPGVNQGFGRVDLNKLSSLKGKSIKFIDDKKGLIEDEKKEIEFSVNKRGLYTATLVYSDVPAKLNSKKDLVNDLDMKLYNTETKEMVLSREDRLNNIEFFENVLLKKGTYRLTIFAKKVVRYRGANTQPYALIMSKMDMPE